MRKTDELTAWRIFIRAADLKRFSRVAEEFELDTSSVTRQINALEKRVGTNLLYRSTTGVTLTGAGERAYRTMQPLVSRFLQMTRSLAVGNSDLAGEVRILLPSSLGEDLIIPWIAAFAERQSELRFDIQIFNGSFRNRPDGFDLTVLPGDLPCARSRRLLLGLAPQVLTASPEYLKRRGIPMHPTDLPSHAILDPTGSGGKTELTLTHNGSDATVSLEPAQRFRYCYGAAAAAAMAGAGICLHTFLFRAVPEISLGRLKRVLPEWTQPSLPIYAVVPLEQRARHPAQALINFMRVQWAGHPELESVADATEQTFA